MKINKSILVGILLLTIIFMGAANAAEEYNIASTDVVASTGDYKLSSPVTDEIYADGDVNSLDSSSVDVTSQNNTAVGNDVKIVENSKEKLGASNDGGVLGDDYDYILTPQTYAELGGNSEISGGSFKFEGTFRADDGFSPFISFQDCIVDGSEAEFVDIGIILKGNCQITGLTITSTNYLEDSVFGDSPGAIVYVTGEGNILDGITVNYAPDSAYGDAYGIYVISANNFKLLNSNITFTGSSLEEYYEYAMRMETCDEVLVQENTIIANLPILNVDYSKGDPGLATDLVLNTGIRQVTNLDIINNTFIANVVDRNGDYPTLDCVMMEYCGYVNVIDNKFREEDFITNAGEANYLNVLDMYYSSNVLVQGNEISVETTGGSENAGTSYPIQLTGPYENVLIDGNTLYANCGGPALGIYSQNYYGDTEITVQNNNIDVTGLPTDHSWGLVSGIELQDNVARVYNNTITTRSITGSYGDGMNIYGISYAQALNENHNYDIRGNSIETEGQYTIYLLKAQDTTITDNYLLSSTGEGDDTVYIRDASGNTVVENNYGANEGPDTSYGIVTNETWDTYFDADNSGRLKDSVPEGATLDFRGKFLTTDDKNFKMIINKPINIISSSRDAYVDLNTQAGSLMGENPGDSFTINYGGSGTNVSGIYFHNSQMWLTNTHNVTLDNVSVVVESRQVGSGVGVTAIRNNSTNVTVKNSYFYTRDNGGSTTIALSWADYCTIENNTILVEGNVGNMIYLNTYNVDIPSGVSYNKHNIIKNNVIWGNTTAASIRWGIVINGAENIIDNNTIHYNKGVGLAAALNGDNIAGNVFSNNKLYDTCSIGGMTPIANAIFHDNYVSGNVNVGTNCELYNNTVDGTFKIAAGCEAYENTIGGDVTANNAAVHDNTIGGTVTLDGEDASASGTIENLIVISNVNVANADVTGTLTFIGSNSVVSNSTVNNVVFGDSKNRKKATNSKLINSNITGTVSTTYRYSTENSLIGNNISQEVTLQGVNDIIYQNNIITTGDYAVDASSTRASSNNISDNYLISNGKKGDGSVTYASGKNHIIENNGPDLIIEDASDVLVGNGNNIVIKLLPSFKETDVVVKVNNNLIGNTNSPGLFTQVLSANDLTPGLNTVEVTAFGITKTTTFNVIKIGLDLTEEITLGENNSLTVTITDGTGEVTIKVNGAVIATPTLVNGIVTQIIPASDIVAGENTVEVTYNGFTNSTTFNAVEVSNLVTPNNFFSFFDSGGQLLDTVEFNELIFKGEFENLVDYISIYAPLTIVGDDATLKNIGFIIKDTGEVTLNNLKLVADTPLGILIDVSDSYDVNLTNLDITYDGGDQMAVAINVAGDNINILNNTIFFESHVSDDSDFAVGLKLTGCTDILVDGNDITTKLPCVYCNNYDEDYFMMGSDKVDPVRLKNCRNLVFTNNFINSTTNDYSADFPTIQSIQIIGCHDSILDNNIISMIDEMTPTGMDNYLYGINFGYNTNVTFSNNNFNMSTLGGKDAAGTAYAFQGVESEVIIKGNNITSISNGPNLGIYVASMDGGDSDLIIEGNFINVTGSASSTGSWALVSGIEIQNGDAKIYNNTIYTYNVNTYDEYAYMYGISYAQWMYGDRSFDIQDNTVYTEGKYTISVIDATSLNAERNILYARELTGDDSVNPGSCADVNIKHNLPTNIVTQDNFYDFFDEFGNLLDSVEYDELIFQGNFSNLVSYITIGRALTITGDDAVLNNIGFVIASSGVTLDNMTLVAKSNLGNLIDIAVENVVISNMDINYVVDEAASAINVNPGVNNVQILNNTIYFESTVDTYVVDEVTTAICVNSGVSIFGDEDPIEGLVIDGNDITAVIPAFLADVYENEYYVMGLSAVNGVRINGAKNFKFTNNKLNVTTNWLYRTTPTFQALYVASSSGLIDGNNISMIDTFTPLGKDVYLHAVELIKDEELTISNNNFNLSTTGGKDEAGSAHAIIAIESNFNVVKNNITAVSNGPNIAIYFPSNMGAPCEAVISGNFINVTGLATATHNTGLVSGIEIQTGDVEITGNTIYTYNIDEYAEGNYIYGISYAQDGINSKVKITDNTVITEGHYAVSFIKVDGAVITDNYLLSTDLKGDNAVEIKAGSGNTVENNTPKDYANISIETSTVWIGNNATVTVTVANATGSVTISVNGKEQTVELTGGVATGTVSSENLVAGENNVTVTYNGPEYLPTTVYGDILVLDGVITNSTYKYYFDASGNLVSIVPNDVTLDFQGLFLGKFPVYINKAVNVVSTTGDALFDCGDSYAGNDINSFNIVAGGDNTNITGLKFINYCLYIKGASNVTVDDISIVANKSGVGRNTGFLSIHTGAYNTLVKNSYFENGGTGSSLLVLGKGGAYAVFDHNVFNITGSSGNILSSNQFVGSGNNPEYVSYTNNVLYNNQPASQTCYAMTVSGSGNLVENNTIYHNGSGILNQYGASSSGNVYRNNTLYGNTNFNPSANSIVENNKIYTTTNIAANTIVSGNTFTTVAISGTGTKFVNNTVTGTVTVNGNAISIAGNNITATGDYAVDLKDKTGNNVTDNYLVSALYGGDAAVKFTNANNIVENNYPKGIITADRFEDGLTINVTDKVSLNVTLTDETGKAISGATVVFLLNNTEYTNVTDAEGKAYFDLSGIAVGEYLVNYRFDGNENYSKCDLTVNDKLTVSKISTEIKVANATVNMEVGSEIGSGAYLTPADAGNVTYTVSNYSVVKVENGKIIALGEGTATITVSFAGDDKYAAAGNKTIYVTVNPKVVPKENLTLGASADPITVGENATVVVTGFKDATGNVTVTVNGKTYTVPINGDKVTIVVPGLIENATALISYSGDAKYNNASASVDIVVNPKSKENATISIDAPSEATEGENVTVTVTLPRDATGSVTIGNEVVPVKNGTASVVLTNVPAGNTIVPVTYSGDDKYNSIETSVAIKVNEKPVPPKENLTISASADPITVGEDAVIVVSGFKDATGNVAVSVNGKTYTASINGDKVTVVVSGLIDNASALISYPGDVKYNAASTTVDIVVNPKAKENATISIDAPEITEGESATVTVTLPRDATGSVTIGGKVVPVKDGVASAVLANLPVGNNKVPVTYSGDDKYNSIETSIVVTVNEKPVPPKENLTISASADPITVGEGAVIVVSGFKDATGNVAVSVNGKTYTAPIKDGKSTITVSGLTENAAASVTYTGDDKYNAASTTVDIVVNPKAKENATMNIGVPPVTEGQNAIVNVELPKDATGNVSAVVGGKTYVAPIKDGKATITIPELAAGNYNVPVTYSGDDKYNQLTEEIKITVDEDKSDIIKAPDVTKYFNGPERFVVTVTDYQGKPLANKSVTIFINGVPYNRKTNDNGTTSIALKLGTGVYNATVTVDNKSINSVVTILSTSSGNDITKVSKNGTQYYATFRDSQGNYLKEGETVRFNINGVMYDRKISGDKGLAKLNINLEAGEYVITAINLVTGDKSSNTITVLSRITENADLIKYYRNSSQYTVKILGSDGKSVGAGESVTFNINGVLYTRQTDANGIAKLNINLHPGDYIITAEYQGSRVSNNIKVLPVLSASDISMKYRDGTKFKANLVDSQGKPYAGQFVTFNINGVFYNRMTDSNGQAKLNINLMPGEYIITSSYNSSSISNTIKISA